MNNTPEENISKFRAFLLKQGMRTLEKMLEILDAINAPVRTDLVEDGHHIPSEGSPKQVILNINHHKDSR